MQDGTLVLKGQSVQFMHKVILVECICITQRVQCMLSIYVLSHRLQYGIYSDDCRTITAEYHVCLTSRE